MTSPEYPDLLPMDEVTGGHAACSLTLQGLAAAVNDPYAAHLGISMEGEQNTTSTSTEFVYTIQGRRFRTIVRRDDD